MLCQNIRASVSINSKGRTDVEPANQIAYIRHHSVPSLPFGAVERTEWWREPGCGKDLSKVVFDIGMWERPELTRRLPASVYIRPAKPLSDEYLNAKMTGLDNPLTLLGLLMAWQYYIHKLCFTRGCEQS